MAQLIKISELSTISSVTGPELIPIVQGGVTDKILFSTLKNNIVATAQGLINTAVAALELEDVAINGLIDDTNTIVSGHTVTINSHTITIGDHTTSIGTLTSDVAALEAEDIAINGLIDDINIAIAALPNTLYTGSGTLFDTGVATTRDFLFETSDDATYNPLGKTSEFRFNGYYNTVGGWSTEAGTLGMKTSKSGLNKLAVFNMYSTNPTVEIAATDTTTAYVRKLVVDSDKLELSTTFISGLLRFTINTNGASIMDTRSNPFGLEYAADYSASLVSKDSSVPDVKTVKLLREDSNTWTTGTRPTAVAGKHGFNTTTSKFEGYNGTTWVDFA